MNVLMNETHKPSATSQKLLHVLVSGCFLPGWTLCQCPADPALTDVSEVHMRLLTRWTERGRNKTQQSL